MFLSKNRPQLNLPVASEANFPSSIELWLNILQALRNFQTDKNIFPEQSLFSRIFLQGTNSMQLADGFILLSELGPNVCPCLYLVSYTSRGLKSPFNPTGLMAAQNWLAILWINTQFIIIRAIKQIQSTYSYVICDLFTCYLFRYILICTMYLIKINQNLLQTNERVSGSKKPCAK